MSIQETNYAKKHGCKPVFAESRKILTRNLEKFWHKSKIQNVLIKIAGPWRTLMLQEKPPDLQREHPALHCFPVLEAILAFLHPDPNPQRQNCSLDSLKKEFMRAWLNFSRMSLPMVSATCWLMLKSVRGISVPKQKNDLPRKFS
jgi:hypothetical protein